MSYSFQQWLLFFYRKSLEIQVAFTAAYFYAILLINRQTNLLNRLSIEVIEEVRMLCKSI